MTQASDATLASAKAKWMPGVEFDTAFTQLDGSPALDLSFLDLGIAPNLPSIVSNDNFISTNATISMPIYASGLITSGINQTYQHRKLRSDCHRGYGHSRFNERLFSGVSFKVLDESNKPLFIAH
ncbi:MAG: hypothetical protein ACI8VW_003775 [bacterium]|jgi:hypothetical protein